MITIYKYYLASAVLRFMTYLSSSSCTAISEFIYLKCGIKFIKRENAPTLILTHFDPQSILIPASLFRALY